MSLAPIIHARRSIEGVRLPSDFPSRFWLTVEPPIAANGARHWYGFRSFRCEAHLFPDGTRHGGCRKDPPLTLDRGYKMRDLRRRMTRIAFDAIRDESYPATLDAEEGDWLPGWWW